MSTYLRIICTSDTKITVTEIVQFIQDGGYFEQQPQVIPTTDKGNGIYDGGRLLVNYDPKQRPLIIVGNVQDDLFRDEIDELLDVLEQVKDEGAQEKLRKHLTHSKQIIAIEVGAHSLSEDAWHMLDSLEAYLAKRLQGIIFSA